jgi:hypothetical protein
MSHPSIFSDPKYARYRQRPVLTIRLAFDRELWLHFCAVAKFSDDSSD